MLFHSMSRISIFIRNELKNKEVEVISLKDFILGIG